MARADEHDSTQPSHTVLIVDDEEDVLRSTEMLVETLGYRAVGVQDPGTILEVAEREQPGVILQDLKMKDLSIPGLVASLRSNRKTAEIPIVFFSASSDLAHTAAKYDAWGYLSKPFGEEELAQVLQKAFQPGGGPEMSPEALRREMTAMFHDYWNLVAALNGYTQVLAKSEQLPERDRKAIKGIEEILLKLESKTDRLRAYLTRLVDASAPPPRQPMRPREP